MRYYLRALGHRFVILDAGSRVEEAWRERWDELYLFTRAALDALPGLPFPAAPASYPSKDDMANYLEANAAHFDLPLRLNTRVDSLTQEENRYLVKALDQVLRPSEW